MRIIVTGAAGFVGKHLVQALLGRDHQVVAVDRDGAKLHSMPWLRMCEFVVCDIHDGHKSPLGRFGLADAVIHLAWPGLPNYQALFHYESNLPADCRFLKSLVVDGYTQIAVAGTCLEYGRINGCLSEELATQPVSAYGLAKDTLRKYLEALQADVPYKLQWLRLFYLFGSNQNPNSLLARLNSAIERGDPSFNLSGGEQLRDYISVQQASEYLAMIVENRDFSGIVNVCSGQPISVRRMVENYLAETGNSIMLNFGHYPYPDYEPMAFWGDTTCLNSLVGIR